MSTTFGSPTFGRKRKFKEATRVEHIHDKAKNSAVDLRDFIMSAPDLSQEDEAFSPASSVSSAASSMSTSSDASPVPSPAASISSADSAQSNVSDFAVLDNRRRSWGGATSSSEPLAKRSRAAFRDSYEARLQQPLVPVQSAPCQNQRLLPKATHKSHVDEQKQSLFQNAVIKADIDEIDDILRRHSESIDINKYDGDGQTPIQRFCQAGNLGLVKLLVQYGADLKLRTREGWSMIHIASFTGNPAMLSFVLKSTRR